MSRCVWVDLMYKVILILVGAYTVTPGLGKADSNIPHFYFNWTQTNERFNATGGAKLSVPVNSNLVIKCPVNPPTQEYYRIYWVSEYGYKNCILPPRDSQFVFECVPPYRPPEYVQEIKMFTGVPGSKDFHIGKNYFLATFSNGDHIGLENNVGGACLEYKMKLNITITNGTKPTTPRPSHTPVPTTPRPVTSRSTSRKTSTTVRSTTSTTQSTTSQQITSRPYPTDIPSNTDVPVITVPDQPGGNTGVIDISSAHTLHVSWALALSLCLSLLHILNLNIPYIQR